MDADDRRNRGKCDIGTVDAIRQRFPEAIHLLPQRFCLTVEANNEISDLNEAASMIFDL